MESTAMGLVAGISVYTSLTGKTFLPPPEDTCIGALLHYITTKKKDFQPMNINFGLLKEYRKKDKAKIVANALESISIWKGMIENNAGL
jgi:methylenetetrahydrofolate--tRNA-(uracil-5-)-methyltransferase